MAKHSQKKSVGKGSKRAQRIERAKERSAFWATLTPEQKREVQAKNKAEYDSQHKSGG